MKFKRALVILSAALSLVLAAEIALAEEATSCGFSLKSWRLEHPNPPESFDELMAMDGQDQRLAFSFASPARQAEFWQVHFERYLDHHVAELSPAQIDLVTEASGLATERFFRTPAMDPSHGFLVKAPLEKVLARAYELFSDRQIRDIFYRLGSTESPARSLKVGPACNCMLSLDCGGGGQPGGSCFKSIFSCTPNQSGCGPYYTSPCEGICAL